MDLTYMPGEIDLKTTQKSNSSDMKREHDSVDDFEHLDPESSPVDNQAKDFLSKEKLDIKTDNGNSYKSLESSNVNLSQKSLDFLSDNIPSKHDLLSDFSSDNHNIKSENDFSMDNQGKTSLMDLEKNSQKSLSELSDINEHSLNADFISAEVASHRDKIKHENKNVEVKAEESVKDNISPVSKDDIPKPLISKEDSKVELDFNGKSMKEADALPQYDIKYERKEDGKDEAYNIDDNESEIPSEVKSENTLVDKSEIPSVSHDTLTKDEPIKEFSKISDESKEPHSVEATVSIKPEPAKTPSPPIVTNTKTEPAKSLLPPIVAESVKPAVKKMSASDLDDIIGPEDVFKRIGLDAWFTPERLHPKVEALVYWRDPKKSGIVFGGVMAILLSLYVMSLISVIAYSSLFVLMGTICFRIYKNILQAVQKTSEGHPFKEFLELELSLPQDKVREMVDTAVVHINAAVVELRRLFLVEDLIDSIKFGVCLWCLTYVGALFNGMTLVILAFVALFTVPKIYENNKASIDQYIDLGRSKVAEITSKVKAAVPIGKKEPEKDKEQ